MVAVRQVFPAHAEGVVKGEQGFFRTGDCFNRNAVVQDFRFHVLHAFPGLEKVGGQGFQTIRRIFGGVPVGTVGAVVEQPFCQARRDGIAGVALGHQFQVGRLRGRAAAVPPPPVAFIGKAQPGGLQGVVLLEELGNDGHYLLEVVHAVGVQQDFRQLNLADDGKFQPVAEQAAFHGKVFDAAFRQDGVNQGVRCGGRQAVIPQLADGFLLFRAVRQLFQFPVFVSFFKKSCLAFLIVFQPADGFGKHPLRDIDRV